MSISRLRVTRRQLLTTTGAAGALALTELAKARLAKRAGRGISPAPSGAITSRAFTETTGTTIVSAGSPFRFGLGLKQGDVPSGNSIALKDGASNALTAQFDAINYWPDGSVRFCEVSGYTARAIAAGGSDTISIYNVAGPFNNSLPGSTTPAGLLTALQSFTGAQNLIIECDSVASCTGHSSAYTAGNWAASFNTLLAGSYVQQVNKGPCCMGFVAWGGLTNGSILHAHLHARVYVWLWLNPSTGAIRDVEYLVYLHNSLLTQNIDGSAQYSTYPPDRYNYNPSLKNGSTVIQSFTLNPGTASTVGGHHIRAGWWTARADGKPRWIAGTVEAQNLQITLDPVQANPQTTITARSYLLSTNLIPKYDVAGVSSTAPPTGANTPISYAPMVKGLFEDENFSDWNTLVAVDTGGAHATIGMIPQWNVRDLMLQTTTTAQNHRISALGWASLPRMYLDINGRIPNLRNQPYTGMTAAQPNTWCAGDSTNSAYANGVTPSTEAAGGNAYSYGNWMGQFEDTSHYPSGAYYTYLMEGGAHNRDIVLTAGHFPIISKSPGNPPPVGETKRDPLLNSVQYYGNVMCSTLANRDEAWAFRELVFAAAIAPAALADGTTYGEGAYYKDLVNGNSSYAAAMINTVLTTNEVNNGFWQFWGNTINNTVSQNSGSSGTSDPWMVSYMGEAWARGKLLHGGELWGGNLTTMCNMNARYFAGLLGSSFCSILSSAQSINVKNGPGVTTFKANWTLVGKFPMQGANYPNGDVWMNALFNDTSTGWIRLYAAHNGVASWPECPFDVGSSIIFTGDYFNGYIGPINAAPSPFVMETQVYYVVATDLVNFRMQVSTTPNGSPVVPAATQTKPVLFNVLNTSSCPATYKPGVPRAT